MDDGLKKRFKLLDFVLLTLITAVIVYIIYRIRVSIRYEWSWDIIPKYLFRFDEEKNRYIAATIMRGFMMTIKLSIWGIILGTAVGLLMGILRVRKGAFSRFIGRMYVELIRNIPPIVLIFIFYFFFSSQILDNLGIEAAVARSSPAVKNLVRILFIEPKLLNEFLSAAISIAIYEGAYITEIIRAGIESIPKGQWEAAHSIGLSGFSQFRLIILPQAFKNVLPPLSGQFISTIKDSAIVSVISVPELSFQGMQVMASTYATFETWIVITLLYFILTFSCSILFGQLLKRLQTAD